MPEGLLAVGDSLTNGHNSSLARVPGISWSQWLADAMDVSYTRYARGGATAEQIVADLVPRVRSHYSVGTLSMGTNDSLQKHFNPAVFQRNAYIAAETMASHCDRVVALTVSRSMAATVVMHDIAEKYGVIVVDGTLTGIRHMNPDGIHPTALGQLELADRAAAALGVRLPSELANDHGRGRLGTEYVIRYPTRQVRFAARRAASKLIHR